MTIRTIVAAVDASEPARRAAARALNLAGRFEAALSLVQVYGPGPAEGLSLLNATSMVETNRRIADKAMQVLVAQLGSTDVKGIVEVGSDVPGTISRVAHDQDADLVVVGTIGRTGVSRFFLGSVAENVMRRAHCPVWVERASAPLEAKLERLMVCTDLSPLSEAGLALAAQFASELELSVEVVYALEPTYRGLTLDVRRDVIDQLQEQLAALTKKHFDGSPRVTIAEGANVVDALTAHASRTSPDLLVLATHGRTGLGRAFMGSVAERVARFAPCSVLVARSPVED